MQRVRASNLSEANRLKRQVSALVQALGVLIELDAPPEVVEQLKGLCRELMNKIGTEVYRGSPGKKPRDWTLRLVLAASSAAVTVLKNGRGVDAAISRVAVSAGVDRKELKSFRNRLNRGLGGHFARPYNRYLSDFAGMTEAQIIESLDNLSDLLG
jgi:hypothetical protein